MRHPIRTDHLPEEGFRLFLPDDFSELHFLLSLIKSKLSFPRSIAKKGGEELKVIYLVRLPKSDFTMRIAAFRRAHFNAAHRLHNPAWSEEKNQQVFGVCNNPNYHGHNYDLEVKVTGEVDPESGYLIDLKILKDIINEEVEQRFDHKNLNLDTEEFRDLNPTAENICYVIWQKLSARLEDRYEVSVRLWETPRNYVEYPA
jgi:6-pyruvoyltetrahydropterin/6-carboxytetrahydropterin synthase